MSGEHEEIHNLWGGGVWIRGGPRVPDDGKWHHWIETRDDEAHRVFIDGELRSAVFNRALSVDEIKKEYGKSS